MLGLFAGALLIAAPTLSSAQETQIRDGINPAPNAAPMAPAAHGATTSSKIMDGINPAPNVAPMSPAAHGASAQTQINDGINPAPNYPVSAAASTRGSAATKSAMGKTGTKHASHHKTHTHAS